MKKPVILAVDDDPEVLGAIERDLKRRFSDDYRVVRAGSGSDALDVAQQVQQRGEAIALFLVDQRMPGMTGTAFLLEARKFHPEARKVLLTAYADTDVAIQSINDVGLDHYLMKPWDPPEERLYPVLVDLLSEWSARIRLPFDGIRIAGALTSPASYATKEFLSRNQVPYQWIDVDRDAATRELIASRFGEGASLPIVLLPDGTALENPSPRELAERVGLQTQARRPFYDVIIVGGGPAGLAHAVYGASEGLKTLLIEQSAPGGQAGTSSRIENYLGFPAGVTGADLAQRAIMQAKRFGAEILTAQEVIGVAREDPYRLVRLSDGSEVAGYTILIATGMSVRPLEARGIEPFLGTGVYYGAAMTEAATYRDRDICIVGGANSAGQGALFFARYARHVTMLIRAPALSPRMSRYLVERIETTENISVIPEVEVEEVLGSGTLSGVRLCDVNGGPGRTIETAAMFVFIGARPRTESFQGLLDCDDRGFVLTGPDLKRDEGHMRQWPLDRDPMLFETSLPGVFAAGDVRSGANRRVAAAVGDGSAAIYSVQRYLKTV